MRWVPLNTLHVSFLPNPFFFVIVICDQLSKHSCYKQPHKKGSINLPKA